MNYIIPIFKDSYMQFSQKASIIKYIVSGLGVKADTSHERKRRLSFKTEGISSCTLNQMNGIWDAIC